MASLLLRTVPLDAQEQSGEWKFRVTPYFVGTGMSGQIAVHGRTATVDVGFEDILRNLEFGAMLHLLAESGPWSLGLDGIYMGLGGTSEAPPADADLDQWLVELTGGYRVIREIELLVGARYNRLSAEIAFQGERLKEKSGAVDWFDPVFGTRIALPLSERWTARGRGDIGGFNIGSKLTWQLAAYVEFRASQLIAITGGYRALNSDYETGGGDELFRYDVTVSGPALGVSFLF